jgi:predicted unusual protein kinase regulating ubiquinone biosynthesis (AarF/ABC1/UbiB family)
MKFSPHCVKRYKDLLVLFFKYRQPGINSKFAQTDIADPAVGNATRNAEELPRDLERLGPTFVKLGQLLSSRADLLPAPYLKHLARLQDRVTPFRYEQLEQIVESELGVPISKAFALFEREPLAAASLGQVHRAVLPDGHPVVVKVQRPNITRQIAEDFEALEEIARFLRRYTQMGQRVELEKVLQEFEHTLAHELDYRREAANMVALAKSLSNFKRLIVPLPIEDYTTQKVLTMDYIEGTKITELLPRAELDSDRRALADELFQAYLQQILVDGLFHADPHPGNILMTADNRIALLDLGMVGHTTPGMQENLLKLLLAISEGESEQAADIAIRISSPSLDFDDQEFHHKIGQLVAEACNATLQEMRVGRVVLSVGRIAAETGLRVPTELSLLGKTLLQLDEIGRILQPDFDPNDSIRRHASQILHQRLKSSITEGKAYSTLLEAKQFLGALPSRLNKILDSIGNAELNVNVKPSETEFLVDSARKVANRITMGLILAALIVGAALLMRVPTTFQLFGYPGLAIMCFLAAAVGGIWLVLSIVWQDFRAKRKSQSPRF